MSDIDAGVESPDVESEARGMGWVPQEEFQGDKSRWISAEDFVERGKNILPIVQANSKRYKEALDKSQKEVESLKKSLDATNKAVTALKKVYDEQTESKVKDAVQQLRREIKAARDQGDVDTEIALEDKLTDLQQQAKESKAAAPEKDLPDPDAGFDPEFIRWRDAEENSWFKNPQTEEDQDRIDELLAIGNKLRRRGDTSPAKEFMAKCMKLLEEKEGGKATPTKTTSKVEGGNTGGRANSNSRPFDRLSAEAKKICNNQSDDFVGPGKKFKTKADWQDYYAELVGEE
jgi:hypothetical protein